MRGRLRFELAVHLVCRHVHLVQPPLQQGGVVGLQRRVALRQARDLDLLRQNLVVQGLRSALAYGLQLVALVILVLTLTSSSRILHRSSQLRSRRVPPSLASRSSRTSSRRPRTSSSLSRRLSAIASCLFCAAACVRYSVASSVRIAFSCASRCETSGADEDLLSAVAHITLAGRLVLPIILPPSDLQSVATPGDTLQSEEDQMHTSSRSLPAPNGSVLTLHHHLLSAARRCAPSAPSPPWPVSGLRVSSSLKIVNLHCSMTSFSGSFTFCCAISRARITFCHSGGAPSAAILLVVLSCCCCCCCCRA